MIRRSLTRADRPFTTMHPCRHRGPRTRISAVLVGPVLPARVGRFAKVDKPDLHGVDEQINLCSGRSPPRTGAVAIAGAGGCASAGEVGRLLGLHLLTPPAERGGGPHGVSLTRPKGDTGGGGSSLGVGVEMLEPRVQAIDDHRAEVQADPGPRA